MPGMVVDNMEAVNYVPVLRGEDWLLAYSAQGLAFELALDKAWVGASARWFNPRTGEWGEAFDVKGGRIELFVPPTAGRGNDWALKLVRER